MDVLGLTLNTRTSPTIYYNVGFLAYSVTNEFEVYYTDDTGSVEASCTTASPSTIGLVPTVTPVGFTNPYYAPLDSAAWSALLPQSWSSCSPGPDVSGSSRINIVSALTTTETKYGDYVRSQVSVATSKNQGTAVPEATGSVPSDKDAQTKAITPARPSAASVSATKMPQRPPTSQDQPDAPPAPSRAPKELPPAAIRPNNNPQPDSSKAGGTSLNSGAAPTAVLPELAVISGTTIKPGAAPVTIGGGHLQFGSFSARPRGRRLYIQSSTTRDISSGHLGYHSRAWRSTTHSRRNSLQLFAFHISTLG